MTTHRGSLHVAACGAMFIYAVSVVAMPVCLLQMREDLGFQLTGGGALETGRTALLLAMLLISGWVAMRWGKVQPLAIGLYVTAAGLAMLSQCHAYTTAMACIMFVGAGSGLVEALVNPLVQDLHPKDAGRYLNITNAFFSFGVMGGTLLMGEALTQGATWRAIMLALAVASLCCGLLFTSSRKAALPASAHSAGHIAAILLRRRFWFFGVAMVCAGATEAAYTFWSASYVQLHFDQLPRAGAAATALFAGAMAFGRLASGKAAHYVPLPRIILASALLGAVVAVMPPFVESVWMFYLSLVLAGLSVACFWPTIQAHAAATMDVDSTLLFIFLSCLGIPGYGLISLVMGIIGDAAGLQWSFWVVPALFLLLAAGMIGAEKTRVPAKAREHRESRLVN